MFVHRFALGGGIGQLKRYPFARPFAYRRRLAHRSDGPLPACQPFCADSPELCGQSVRYRHVCRQHVAYRRQVVPDRAFVPPWSSCPAEHSELCLQVSGRRRVMNGFIYFPVDDFAGIFQVFS